MIQVPVIVVANICNLTNLYLVGIPMSHRTLD